MLNLSNLQYPHPEHLEKKDNKMIVKGLLNVAKGIPFFVNLQEEYKQKMDVNVV